MSSEIEGQIEGQIESQSEVEDQKASNREHADSGDTGGKPPKDGQWIPKHRFDEVNQGYTKYKEFGSPDEIRKGLTRLHELEALPQNRTTDKEKQEIRKELLSVFPELRAMSDMLSVQKEAYTERGAVMNEGFLKELNIEHSESTNQYMQELLSGIIAADKKLLRRFYAMDNDVFKDAFAVAKKTLWPNIKRIVPGASLQAKKVGNQAPVKQKLDNESDGYKTKAGQPLDRMGERDLLDKAGEEAFALLDQARGE